MAIGEAWLACQKRQCVGDGMPGLCTVAGWCDVVMWHRSGVVWQGGRSCALWWCGVPKQRGSMRSGDGSVVVPKVRHCVVRGWGAGAR